MQRRMLATLLMSAALPVAGAQAAAARSSPVPVVFGGVTEVTNAAGGKESAYPIVIRLNRAGTRVLRATIGIALKCQTPGDITIPDDVSLTGGIPIKGGRFVATQPVTHFDGDPSQGTPPFDVSARISGRVNRARTQIRGSWSRTVVIYDASAPTTVLDTCSATLRYTADN